MKALIYHKKQSVKVETVEDPKIIEHADIILKVTSTAICGSDLHLYNGYNPTMEDGDILGHEFMGEIIETGKAVKKFKKGDRVLIPFPIACGKCFFCQNKLTSLCDNTNPNKDMQAAMFGYPTSAIYGYSHLFGGIAGGQAEYVRVINADANAFKVPEGMPDEKVLFMTDIFPTGYMAAENANIKMGDVVAVFGCGPVGQFAIKSAYMLGAKNVIAIDCISERLQLAKTSGKAQVINHEDERDIVEALKELTDGRGPDSIIDAVGMEAHGIGIGGAVDKLKHEIKLQTDRPTALRQAIQACRKGGTVSIAGVYSGVIDTFPIGTAFNKGLTFKMGQTHVHPYLNKLIKLIQRNRIDPSFVITHTLPLCEAPHAYEIFSKKEDNCIKVVLKP